MSFADARIDDRYPAYYEGTTAEAGAARGVDAGTGSEGGGPSQTSVVVFKYVSSEAGPGSAAPDQENGAGAPVEGGVPGIDGDMGSGAPAERSEPVTSSAADPDVGWREPEGVQAVAQAILTHYTGSEPDQAALEALVMAKGDVWASAPDWTLTVRELDEII